MSKKQFDPKVVRFAKEYFKTLQSIDAYEQDITQFSNLTEAKRFAYFFKDNLTGLFNKDYFHIILNQKSGKLLYKNLYVVCIKGMGSFNEQFGWSKGDELLKDFGEFLENSFLDVLIFRVYGDDFLILQKRYYQIHENDFLPFKPIKNKKISIQLTLINLEKTPLKSAHELEIHLHSCNKTLRNTPYM